MNNDCDAVLIELFTEADKTLDDGAFTQKVLKRTYGLVIRLGLLAMGIAAVVLAGAVVMGLVPLSVAQQLSNVLTTSLIELGEGWAAWVLAPINSIGGALVISAKVARVLYKRIMRMA
jgi:hypothetical protein